MGSDAMTKRPGGQGEPSENTKNYGKVLRVKTFLHACKGKKHGKNYNLLLKIQIHNLDLQGVRN